MTSRIVATLSALLRQADFSLVAHDRVKATSYEERKPEPVTSPPASISSSKGMRPEFHYNLQIHLPNNATEEVYLNIFNALRKTFQ